MPEQNTQQPLTKEEAIAQNQKMIDEWKQECAMDNLLAYCMIVLDDNTAIRLFSSQVLKNYSSLANQLRFIADELDKKK